VQLPTGNLRMVDLSVLVDESLPGSWPGHMTFAHKNWTWFDAVDHPASPVRTSGPYSTNFFVMDEHCGTHLDGPTHFIPPSASGLPHAGPHGDVPGDKLDLAALWGPCAVIDVTELTGTGDDGRSPVITPEHVLRWEAEHGALQPGEVVLWRTGWDRWYVEGQDADRYLTDPLVRASRPGWPAPEIPVMSLLHERGVRLVGTDGASMGSVHDGAPVHQYALARDVLFVEVLTGLHQLPARGAWFCFLPLKIAGSTGGPGRAVALLPDDDQGAPATA
jgi:kynurenine formamidase